MLQKILCRKKIRGWVYVGGLNSNYMSCLADATKKLIFLQSNDLYLFYFILLLHVILTFKNYTLSGLGFPDQLACSRVPYDTCVNWGNTG